MGFADYLIKARLAAQNSGKLQNSIRKTVNEIAENGAQNPLSNLGDDLQKIFGAPKSDDFVRQSTAQCTQSVRHYGDTFKRAEHTTMPRNADNLSYTGEKNAISDDVLESTDDFWSNRQSEMVDDYMDDVYKSIDDRLQQSPYSTFGNDPFGF